MEKNEKEKKRKTKKNIDVRIGKGSCAICD